MIQNLVSKYWLLTTSGTNFWINLPIHEYQGTIEFLRKVQLLKSYFNLLLSTPRYGIICQTQSDRKILRYKFGYLLFFFDFSYLHK